MSTQPGLTTPAGTIVPLVPPLETGDCMTRAEFERRYEAMPGLKKAELVEGVVYVPSPVSKSHAHNHGRLMAWLVLYAEQTPGTMSCDNATVRLDLENEVQPDALLLIESGGQTKSGSSRYIEGPPELIAEVASSSVSRDLHSKLALYRRHGVLEYIVFASSTTIWTGSGWSKMSTNRCQPMNEAFFAVRCFRACGSTSRRCCAATWRPCWPRFSLDWARPNMGHSPADER